MAKDPNIVVANYSDIGGGTWYVGGSLEFGPSSIINIDAGCQFQAAGAQAGAVAQVATTTPTTGAYGFTLAQAQAIIAGLNAINTALTNLGILA